MMPGLVDSKLIYIEKLMKKTELTLKVCQNIARAHNINEETVICLRVTKLHELSSWYTMTKLAQFLLANFLRPQHIYSYMSIYEHTASYENSDNRVEYYAKYQALNNELKDWPKLITAPKTAATLRFIYDKLREMAKIFSAMACMRESERLQRNWDDFGLEVEAEE